MLPTPTLLPPVIATPAVNINPEDFRIWNYTDEAIQIWNRLGEGATVIQVAVVVVIVIAFVVFLIKAISELKEQP